ncbi:type II toxin-antitoxin system VapC family toxin [Vulgatibacter sp.]|uniref:type II toxin-antitoxin system VapC family toxin n=1 Tax=Vulgatibacter sp. TaxID=1971226 RepID=UPI0035690CBA
MKYLLDTHAFLWWAFDAPELSPTARALIADRSNVVYVSSASAWEIATKHRLGRLAAAAVLLQDVAGWVQKAGLSELPIGLLHAQRAGSFPQPHRDPFDRIIAAQSVVEQVPVIGRDEALRGFGVQLVW